jgi:transcriptional regulator with XRE-family HTH domain
MAKAAILAHQLKAARALARLDQQELSNRSGVSIPTIKRMEAGDGLVRGNYENVAAVVGALEAAGVEFINGDQPGVRLKATASSEKTDGVRNSTPEKTRGRRTRSSDNAPHAFMRIPA